MMWKTLVLCVGLASGFGALAEEGEASAGASQDAAQPQFKALSGMSVLGNNEAPKSLVIVPWKSSQIGDGIGLKNSLDNRPMPVDREVFSRELGYYHIRTGDVADPGQGAGTAFRVGSR